MAIGSSRGVVLLALDVIHLEVSSGDQIVCSKETRVTANCFASRGLTRAQRASQVCLQF